MSPAPPRAQRAITTLGRATLRLTGAVTLVVVTLMVVTLMMVTQWSHCTMGSMLCVSWSGPWLRCCAAALCPAGWTALNWLGGGGAAASQQPGGGAEWCRDLL